MLVQENVESNGDAQWIYIMSIHTAVIGSTPFAYE